MLFFHFQTQEEWQTAVTNNIYFKSEHRAEGRKSEQGEGGKGGRAGWGRGSGGLGGQWGGSGGGGGGGLFWAS